MSNILVVDDSSTMRKIIAMHLQKSGLKISRILSAEHGRAALEVLAKESVDLVLTDMNMPEMGGLALIDALRQPDSEHCELPVVVVSTESESGLVKEALRIGATEYVQKPFTAEQLATILGPHLEGATVQ